MISAFVLVILAMFVSVPTVSVYAQMRYANVTDADSPLIPYGKLIVETQKHLDKLTLMEGTCGDRLADRSDFDILPACSEFHVAFNKHMQDLFNETRDEMTKVLLD